MRSGPPASRPTARSSSCTGLRAAYRNGIAMRNQINAESAALPGQITQNGESVMVDSFRLRGSGLPLGRKA